MPAKITLSSCLTAYPQAALSVLLLLLVIIAACHNNTNNQQRPKTLQQTSAIAPDRARVENLLKKGLLHQANLALDSLLPKYPKEAQLHNLKGLTLARMDKLHEGLNELDQAIALQPDVAEPYYNKALIWYKFQDKIKARQFFDQALSLNPQYADAYYQRGVLNFQEFKKDSACLDWTRAVNFGYKDNLKYIQKYCN